jgi:glycosyltransferase involved in cell wall biosynthesis
MTATLRIAVIVPCHNEERTIAEVVTAMRAALPAAVIYVCDNNCTDCTADRAREAGAIVRFEPRLGKGNAIRAMFAAIEADVYVLIDGDGTYDAASAPGMVRLLLEQDLAMVAGRRVHQDNSAYSSGHLWGNRVFTGAVARLFGATFTDILSGYRVCSRKFVKSFPSFAAGFEIETELTVHALTLRLPVREVQTRYLPRPGGSVSKLHKYRDGIGILLEILSLVQNERPLAFFSTIGCALFATALILAWPVVITFMHTHTVPRFPTAILATGISVSGFVSIACGLILDNVSRGRREAKLLAYLAA